MADLSGGFSAPSVDAAHAFRAALEALARPGSVQDLRGATPPAPLSVAAGTLLLTLADSATPLHLAGAADCDAVRGWLAFHCGAPLVGPEAAMLAVGRWEDLGPLSAYPRGTPDYPDRSATLIVECDALDGPANATLSGPGIETRATAPLPDLATLAENHALYPLGLDFFFTAGARVMGLPRSTRTEAL
ncbi:phosphonate C-P lyase system protein PhnH [Phaeovulum vinaykumarii]|nr:phosphonate C-P lyase system protein PhnH [Phaeovulum vinaykumarii]